MDEENTRSGFVGLTRKIRCLAGADENVPDTDRTRAHRRHDRATTAWRTSKYCRLDAKLSIRILSMTSSCSVK
jgi:hypothetical protein